MPVSTSVNSTINLIIGELKKLDVLEQKEFLAQLRAKRLFRKKTNPLANLSKGVKPLTMAEIDKIKHHSRRKA